MGSAPEDTNQLSLLGGFAFSVGGDALLGISAGSQRLLAFLAVRDRVTTRNHVAGTLWPESTDEHAGASLRQAISRLGGQAREAVKVTAVDLSLAEGVAVDVHHSQSLARRLTDRDGDRPDGDISAASVLALSDDLLPGWYEDWAIIAAVGPGPRRVRIKDIAGEARSASTALQIAALISLHATKVAPAGAIMLATSHTPDGSVGVTVLRGGGTHG